MNVPLIGPVATNPPLAGVETKLSVPLTVPVVDPFSVTSCVNVNVSAPLNQTGFVGCAEATLVKPNVVSWLIAVPPRNAADDNRSALGPVPITVWPKKVAVYVPSPLGITVI